MERLQACVQLMEKVFGSALTVVLRHANPFLHQADSVQKISGLLAGANASVVRYLKQASLFTRSVQKKMLFFWKAVGGPHLLHTHTNRHARMHYYYTLSTCLQCREKTLFSLFLLIPDM